MFNDLRNTRVKSESMQVAEISGFGSAKSSHARAEIAKSEERPLVSELETNENSSPPSEKSLNELVFQSIVASRPKRAGSDGSEVSSVAPGPVGNEKSMPLALPCNKASSHSRPTMRVFQRGALLPLVGRAAVGSST